VRRARVLERSADAPSLLVATDFDGTISEIVPHPDDAVAVPGALAVLAELGGRRGVSVAVVSGRTLADLRARTAVAGSVWLVAEHGAFVEGPDRRAHGPNCVPDGAAIEALADAAAALSRRYAGLLVERKQAGVALHVRGVDAGARAAAIEAAARWAAQARAAGLAILDGRLVVEARWGAFTKAAALARILDALPGATPLVAGDDTTDEAAIALARERGGLGLYVASSERPLPAVDADAVLSGPAEWVALLRAIAARRG
jgi:trehalose-phosphatase